MGLRAVLFVITAQECDRVREIVQNELSRMAVGFFHDL
jgi:hypothetical protein